MHDLTGVRQDRAMVGVQISPGDRRVGRLLERFAERRWQVIDLNAFNWQLPGEVKFAGALLSCLPTDVLAAHLLARGVPCVRLGWLAHPDDAQMPAIIPDQVASGRLAADHFAERGFSHLGFVAYDQWHRYRPLFESFRQRAEELGSHCDLLSLNQEQLKSQVTADRNYYDVQKQHVQAWWRTLPRPLGLLAGNDMAAYRYCQWAIQADRRVPEDMAILGVGNIELTCEGAIVPLSSIDLDESAALDKAIETLGRLMAGEAVEPTTIPVDPRGVVARRSTDVLAASNPHVVAALRFMWDHIADDLSVDRIAREVGVSRRTLEVGFQRELGRGINTEYQRRRLEKGRDLLMQTDWRVAQVAEYLGFSGPKYFAKVFQKTYGASPTRYRSDATDGR
jgi:LacI family transcriptional regulator